MRQSRRMAVSKDVVYVLDVIAPCRDFTKTFRNGASHDNDPYLGS